MDLPYGRGLDDAGERPGCDLRVYRCLLTPLSGRTIRMRRRFGRSLGID
jgi:hypothetical protein